MRLPNLADLSARDAESGALYAIIETPKGSRNKYAYDPELGVFELSKVLPRGMGAVLIVASAALAGTAVK